MICSITRGLRPDQGDPGHHLWPDGCRDVPRRGRRTFAFSLLAASLTPVIDAAIELQHGGRPAQAYGVHATTAAVLVATGLVLINSTPPCGSEARPCRARRHALGRKP